MIPWYFARFAHPRFARIGDLAARLAAAGDWPSIAMLDDCYRAELGCAGVRLVEAGKTRPALGADGTIDPSSLYEGCIVERGEVPTRPRNAHDLCNALAWAAFPHACTAASARDSASSSIPVDEPHPA